MDTEQNTSGDEHIGEEEKSTVGNEKEVGVTAFPEGGMRAWSVALGCGGIVFCTFGYVNSFGYVFQCICTVTENGSDTDRDLSVLQEYYQTHQLQHKSPSDISWIGSLQIFFLFAGSLIGGPLFDKYGAKVC
jgi:hypothetical protein